MARARQRRGAGGRGNGSDNALASIGDKVKNKSIVCIMSIIAADHDGDDGSARGSSASIIGVISHRHRQPGVARIGNGSSTKLCDAASREHRSA